MLRKSMLAVAVATAFAAPAAFADSKNVDIYGVAAFGWMQDKAQGTGDSSWIVLNESRIGFRGSKDLKNGPKFIWQIESGFLGADGLMLQPWESGTLGTRDTFGGFEGDFGKIRFGRLLTPFGEVLDWPYANAGVGPIIEAAKVFNRWDDANYVRKSDHFRWDSPAGGMISGAVSYGRGSTAVQDSSFVSALLNAKVGPVALHVAVENHSNDTATSDTSAQLLGFEWPIGGGFSTYGVIIKGERDDDVLGTGERTSWQAAIQYGAGDWIFKLTHAAAGELEIDGDAQADSEGDMSAVQVLYIADPSAVFYGRVVSASDLDTAATVTAGYESRVLFGMEYYF